MVTLGELRRATALLPQAASARRWKSLLTLKFRSGSGRVPCRSRSRLQNGWGMLDAACHARGTPANTAGGMIAATAVEHGLTAVTRNAKDFATFGITIFNPWQT